MISNELAGAIVFSGPLVCAIVCLVLTIIDMALSKRPAYQRIHHRMVAVFSVSALFWLGLVLHSIYHSAFVFYIPIFVSLVILSPMSVYALVRAITDTGDSQHKFRAIHLLNLLPMIAGIVIILSKVSLEKLAAIIYNPTEDPTGYAALMVVFLLINSMVYRIAGIITIQRQRRHRRAKTIMGNNPCDDHSLVLGHLLRTMIVELFVLPVPICGLLLGMQPFTDLGCLWAVAVIPAMLFYILSCNSMLSGNYMIVEPYEPEKPAEKDNANQQLGRERVERYLADKKPWLDPEFRITDMAKDLFTNRAYISAFINKEYGVNFNRLINGYRLREVERLRQEEAQKQRRISSLQLVLNAGFSSYRSYLRAKEAAGTTNSTT